jgi:beta-glucuronidase
MAFIARSRRHSLSTALRRTAVFAALLATIVLPGCALSTPNEAQLPPTLTMRSVSGGTVAFQNGIAVPSFTPQPRDRLDLADGWLAQDTQLSESDSFAPRERSLGAIESASASRTTVSFDDHTWTHTTVPGGVDLPPTNPPTGMWYRLHFTVPGAMSRQLVTLKFGAVNYLADVWLNGHWLGYHEGGSTPFAFDVSGILRPGPLNILAVRVLDPVWGSRLDVVPWGLTDFWNYAGIVGPVWLEATASAAVVRADVTPHLDAADVTVVVENRTSVDVADASVNVAVMPAAVSDANRLDPNPLDLVPPDATAVVATTIDGVDLPAKGTRLLSTFFQFAQPDLWSPQYPALYVLDISVSVRGNRVDHYADTFGLRRIQVDPSAPRLLLNGEPIVFHGAAIHNESVAPARADGAPHGGRSQTLTDLSNTLRQAVNANVNLIRADHSPAEPQLLMLTDRTGFAVWEEIPLYHETPQTFSIAADRGIGEQMLREMDLRDMNRPSVLFHGFANEGLGTGEREQVLDQLSAAERDIDGTRITGQAMYGSNPSDPTSRNLDVAGYTFYYGVFYGSDVVTGTRAALQTAHDTYPNKPIMVLEFGRWSDSTSEEAAQAKVLSDTWMAIGPHLTTQPGGYVSAAVWWSLQDYWSDQRTSPVEHFGLFKADGSPRQAAAVAASSFAGPVPMVSGTTVVSGGRGTVPLGPSILGLALRLAYALTIAVVLVVTATALLKRRRFRRSLS